MAGEVEAEANGESNLKQDYRCTDSQGFGDSVAFETEVKFALKNSVKNEYSTMIAKVDKRPPTRGTRHCTKAHLIRRVVF